MIFAIWFFAILILNIVTYRLHFRKRKQTDDRLIRLLEQSNQSRRASNLQYESVAALQRSNYLQYLTDLQIENRTFFAEWDRRIAEARGEGYDFDTTKPKVQA